MLSMAQMEGTGQSGGTHEELRRIHENLLFYDEHTFGAAESIWNPGCENSQVQWAEKGSYVWEALKSTQLLYEDAIGRLQGTLYRSTHPTLTFFNPLGWERSELTTVYIDFELIPADREFRIVDAAGKALRVQPIRSRREGRYYAIWAEGIPAMGYKTFEIVLGDGKAAEPPPHGTPGQQPRKRFLPDRLRPGFGDDRLALRQGAGTGDGRPGLGMEAGGFHL